MHLNYAPTMCPHEIGPMWILFYHDNAQRTRINVVLRPTFAYLYHTVLSETDWTVCPIVGSCRVTVQTRSSPSRVIDWINHEPYALIEDGQRLSLYTTSLYHQRAG